MIVRDRPTVTTATVEPCQFHQDFPDKEYAGCTCFVSIRVETKPLGEWTPEDHVRYGFLEGQMYRMRLAAVREAQKNA